jgi:hypothetical protein
VGPLDRVDRPSRFALAAVGILTIVGIGALLLTGSSRPAGNTLTPAGAVTTYVLAIQAGDATRAWAVLAPTGNQPAAGEPPRPALTQDDFRNQLQASRQPTSPRVRILSVSQSGDTATVQLEISHASGDPLTGATTQQLSVSLARQSGIWRITSDAFPWQFQ